MREKAKIPDRRCDTKGTPFSYQAQKPSLFQFPNSPIGKMLYLQKSIGNRAVKKLIKSGHPQIKLQISQTPKLSHNPIKTQISGFNVRNQLLPESTRTFFEPLFGRDNSEVRMHHSGQAVENARPVNSLTFTLGKSVMFGAKECAPGSAAVKKHVSHELTQVVQQSGRTQSRKGTCSTKSESNSLPSISLHSIAAQPLIQRWRYGGWREARPDPAFRPVSRRRQRKVDAAMRLLSRIVGRRRCRNYFRDNCPGGTARTLTRMFFGRNRMAVWALRARGELGANVGSVPNVVHVAYEDPYLWRVGHWAIAGSLLHEMMHGCGIGSSAAEEVTCETAIERCHNYTPYIESVAPASGRVGTTITITGFGFGMSQGRSDRVLFNGINAGAATVWRYDSGVGSEIQITVPARARTGPLVVINNGVRSNVRQFTVTT